MAESSVAEAVIKIVAEQLERDEREITMDARFIEDLGADSLDVTELLLALEEKYKITIDDEGNELRTVGDAIGYIESKVKEEA